ncbi:hypothetical protein FBUS_11423 [Fasciolopsis buskii]|uniref:Uncharacterized protein n=1 Tax=Fasciolopsis buskii TaxID=27845 RepID=A0A8E0RLU6_9TREM|nr:hypothetical protein FBUS_11423 [Fasciolopsis buski]
MGEILVWYGLAANEISLDNAHSVTCLLQPDSDLLETVDDTEEPGIGAGDTADAVRTNLISLDSLQQSDELFEPVRNEITERLRANQSVPYYPVHPSRVHLNVLHWHCQLVQSLCFTPTEFHVVSGALSIIHSQRGFSQLPSVWLQLSRSRSDYMVPQNLLTLSGPSSVPWVLTNGGLGSLQLIDLATDRLAVQKDVCNMSIVEARYVPNLMAPIM